jgi:hypothetical protein
MAFFENLKSLAKSFEPEYKSKPLNNTQNVDLPDSFLDSKANEGEPKKGMPQV